MRLDRQAFAAWLMRQGTPDDALKPYVDGAEKLLAAVPRGHPFDEAIVDAFIAKQAAEGASPTRLANWHRIANATLNFAALTAPARSASAPRTEPDQEPASPVPALPRAATATFGAAAASPVARAPRSLRLRLRRLAFASACAAALALAVVAGRHGVAAFHRRSEPVAATHHDDHLGIDVTFGGTAIWRHLPGENVEVPYESVFPPTGSRSRKATIVSSGYFRGTDARNPTVRLALVLIPLVTDVWSAGRNLERELAGFAEGAVRVTAETFTYPSARWRGNPCDLPRPGKSVARCIGEVSVGPRRAHAVGYVIYGRDDAVVALFITGDPNPRLDADADNIAASINP